MRVIRDDPENPGKKENLGVMALNRALEVAEGYGMDLVEVAPDSDPPVTRIMDFGKFQYEQQRKERKAKKNQVKVDIKEIQLKPKTDEFHIGIYLKNARRWLEQGKKVKVKVRFRGREITHSYIGRDHLESIRDELSDISVVEQKPNMDGRDMIMILAPNAENK